MTDDRAAEARTGLKAAVTGKVKEVAGAVTGKDDLVQEGQLEQAEASKRRAAVADDALAQAQRQEAAEEQQAATAEADQRQTESHAEADRRRSQVEHERGLEHAEADRAASQLEATGEAEAESEAGDLAEARLEEAEAMTESADRTEAEAIDGEVALQAQADQAERRAAALRAEASK